MTTESGLEKIPIAISSCLLGQEVRYDGGHKHNGYITETLGEYFEYTAFCPDRICSRSRSIAGLVPTVRT